MWVYLLLETVAGLDMLICSVGLQDLQDRSIAKWDCWPAVGVKDRRTISWVENRDYSPILHPYLR
ncbi:MAG: hypothetical protein CVU40_16565 [Chloroflexi bacterium HGW-Chloroflexi-2]|nr:MAG: hypothetical protein CVU40_16565 [Chloroflexi bacterium HGW-Chloroflexi-2]